MAVGKNVTWKKGKGKQYPYNNKAARKNIKGEDWIGTEIMGKKTKIFKMGVGKNLKL